MTSTLKLPFSLKKEHIVEHLEAMLNKFMEEKKKEGSKWSWMGQLQGYYPFHPIYVTSSKLVITYY